MQKAAEALLARGLEARDPALVRAGSELRLAAGNVARALAADAEREVSAVSDENRRALAHLQAMARPARGLRPGVWFLDDVALLDARDSADLLAARGSFVVREVRGVAVLDPEADPSITVAGTNLGPDPEGRTALDVSVAEQKIDGARLTRTEAGELVISVPRALLVASGDRPSFVPVALSLKRKSLVGEWPFRQEKEDTSEAQFHVTVVPREAGSLRVEASSGRTGWTRVAPAQPASVETGDTRGIRRHYAATLSVPSSGADPPRLGDQRIVEARWRCVKQIFGACGHGEGTISYGPGRASAQGSLHAWGKGATWQIEADVEEMREADASDARSLPVAVQWGRSAEVELPPNTRGVRVRGAPRQRRAGRPLLAARLHVGLRDRTDRGDSGRPGPRRAAPDRAALRPHATPTLPSPPPRPRPAPLPLHGRRHRDADRGFFELQPAHQGGLPAARPLRVLLRPRGGQHPGHLRRPALDVRPRRRRVQDGRLRWGLVRGPRHRQ